MIIAELLVSIYIVFDNCLLLMFYFNILPSSMFLSFSLFGIICFIFCYFFLSFSHTHTIYDGLMSKYSRLWLISDV